MRDIKWSTAFSFGKFAHETTESFALLDVTPHLMQGEIPLRYLSLPKLRGQRSSSAQRYALRDWRESPVQRIECPPTTNNQLWDKTTEHLMRRLGKKDVRNINVTESTWSVFSQKTLDS